MNIKNEIREFINADENNGALLITGSWGCGKSYLVKSLVNDFNQGKKALKRCVNVGKNSKKYTKSKLFNASKKVRFVLWDKRLHICFTCAKRNYTFQKTSVIISPDIYLQGIFGQFLFIWIFILLGFFCKINYV